MRTTRSPRTARSGTRLRCKRVAAYSYQRGEDRGPYSLEAPTLLCASYRRRSSSSQRMIFAGSCSAALVMDVHSFVGSSEQSTTGVSSSFSGR
jgi:hypothetical protein